MLKKIVLWTLYVAFVGVLIFGALNRTSAKLSDDNGRNPHAVERDSAWSQDSGGNSNAHGQEEGPSHEDDDHEAHGSPEREWITLTGAVSSILPRGMVVAASDGQHIEVARRTWRYALEQGFIAIVGEQVTLDGFYENGEFETACLTNLTNGQIVHLRDETGHPLWASGGH